MHWSQITEEDQVCPAVRVCMRMLQRTLNPLIYLIKTAVSLTHTLEMYTHILATLYINIHLHKHSSHFLYVSLPESLKDLKSIISFPTRLKSSEHGSAPGRRPQAWLIAPDEHLTEKEKGRRQNVCECKCVCACMCMCAVLVREGESKV